MKSVTVGLVGLCLLTHCGGKLMEPEYCAPPDCPEGQECPQEDGTVWTNTRGLYARYLVDHGAKVKTLCITSSTGYVDFEYDAGSR